MSKLLNFKEWVSLPDAINLIAKQTNEKLALKDIYELALNGHLSLAVYYYEFGFVQRGFIVDESLNVKDQTCEAAEVFKEIDDDWYDEEFSLQEALQLSETEQVGWSYKIYRAGGVWDFVPIEAYKRALKNRYNSQLNPNYESHWITFDSIYIVRDGIYARPVIRLDASEGYSGSNCCAAVDFEDDAMLGVRPSELQRFVNVLNGDAPQIETVEKALHPKSRNTYLKIIGALANKYDLSLENRNTTAVIMRATEKIGHPVSDDTIRTVIGDVKKLIG